jgi:ubiquinone/menaquinone biosynthesis C-methylase UbiE
MTDARRREAYWDDQAADWDRGTAWIERRLFAAARAWIGERVHGRVLDVAAGTGANLPYVRPHASHVTVTDFSAAMLAQARRRASTLGMSVDAVQADAARLPFADASFDTVVCTFALCGVEDERAVLAELARVRAPGGVLLVADHVESSAALGRGLQRVLDLVDGRAAGERHRRRPVLVAKSLGLPVAESEASRWRLVEQFAVR